METEHCSMPNSRTTFTSCNYHITTCPADEWRIVVKRDGSVPADMRHGRRIPDIDELMRIDPARKAGLQRAEVISVVQYTGPMVRPGHFSQSRPLCYHCR